MILYDASKSRLNLISRNLCIKQLDYEFEISIA